MGVLVGYSLLALLFLALATGFYQPERWGELPEKKIKFLRFGCLFGFAVIFFNIVRVLM